MSRISTITRQLRRIPEPQPQPTKPLPGYYGAVSWSNIYGHIERAPRACDYCKSNRSSGINCPNCGAPYK